MAQQLALRIDPAVRRRTTAPRCVPPRPARPLCAGCRAKEARYGFRADDEAAPDTRPRTLCFDCFRMALGSRQAMAARRPVGISATQSALPLAQVLAHADRRRRRAQIAARRALELG